MKSGMFIYVFAVIFVLSPLFVYAQTYSGPTVQPPPVSQVLVREGSFAVDLAGALNLGKPANESEAESLLAAVGVAPRNGWVADYPVTPDIAGELQASIIEAADTGKLSMARDDALVAFQNLLSNNSLPLRVNIGGGHNPAEGSSRGPEPEAISNYYYNEGPPVVTYYAPPPDYSYLYSWVPYPFWWWDWWFPGFFVLSDFTVFDGHHHHHGEVCSNHFRNSRTGFVGRIDPARRSSGTGMQHSGTGMQHGGGSGWASASAQKSASAIYNRSMSSGSRNVTAATYSRMMSSSSGNRQFASRGTPISNANYRMSQPGRSYGAYGYYPGRYRSSGNAPGWSGGNRSFSSNGAQGGSGGRVSSGGRGSFGGGHGGHGR
jgi:hypothetical protein